MKKKIVLCLLLGMLMTALTGCDSDKLMETFAGAEEEESEDEDEEEAEDEDEDKKEAKKKKDKDEEDAEAEEESDEEEETEDEEEADESEKKKEKKSKKSDGPVLGGDDVEGYEGFEYLYEELLMTDTEENEETGKKERKKLTVYIPDDDYATASGDYAYANSMGVNFRVELEPYIRYDEEDYLPEENLAYHLENQYDPFYTAEYKDLVIGDVEVLENDAVTAIVEYCEYNEWDEEYFTVFTTYYLVELENGETVLVTVEIDDSETTGKTDFLIEELEQFYQFDIDWDKDRAEQKRTNYAANETENTYSTGSFLFELPMGWKEDTDISDYETRVYSPDGDMAFSGCMVAIAEEYLSYDETVDLQAVIDEYSEEELAADMGAEVTEYAAEICDTALGKAAKISYAVEMDGESAQSVIYVIATDHDVYTFMAMQTEGAEEDAIVVLDGIIATGQIR